MTASSISALFLKNMFSKSMTDNVFEKFPFDNYYLLYSRKVGSDNAWLKQMDKDFRKQIWQMNKSANSLLIVTTNLDDFSQ